MNRLLPISYLSFLFVLISHSVFADVDTLSLKNLKDGIDFNHSWRHKPGDNPKWAAAELNETSWILLNDSVSQRLDDSKAYHGISWYRTSFAIDTLLDGTPLALEITVLGALDVFIDGKLIQSVGKVGNSVKDEKSGFSTRTTIVPLPMNNAGRHSLAIRTSNFDLVGKLGIINISGFSNFEIELHSMKNSIEDIEDITTIVIPVFFAGAFLVLSLFHFILFLYYRRNRSNIYYSLFTFFLFAIFFAIYTTLNGTNVETTKNLLEIVTVSIFLVPLFYMGILYEVFYSRLPRQFWILTTLMLLGHLLFFVADSKSYGVIILIIYAIAASIETIRIIIRSVSKKREGAWVFVFGLIFPILGTISLKIIGFLLERMGLLSASDFISDHILEFLGYSAIMSVSISMTIYLGRDFGKMNKKLREQIQEIKTLFERTIDQENEKKKILENQKEELETKVILRTEEVVRQKAELEVKNKDILDNLLYAKRIQDAILPEIRLIYKVLHDSFVIYWPKDIVSGDFYSFSQRDGKVIISAADCTGHGVTGAFMSMIGSSLLNQIINEKSITTPSQILSNLNTGIADALGQAENVNDGMDISVCTFDLNMKFLQYAGANRPLLMVRDGKMEIIKPDKSAIGGFHLQSETQFTNHEFQLLTGDSIYMFTDGYADQFGGPNGKKILSKRFREMLLSINDLPMSQQAATLTSFFNEWKGREVQVDDVLVIGIRV